MTRSLIALLGLALLWVARTGGAGSAQKPTLDSRIDVRFEATPAADVFRQIISRPRPRAAARCLDARAPVTICR